MCLCILLFPGYHIPALLLFPGSVVLYRSFRHAAPREVHNITVAEFLAMAESLKPRYRNFVSIHLRRQSKETAFFIKNRLDKIQDFIPDICSFDQYTATFECSLHPTVTDTVKNLLHVCIGFFS